MGHKLFINIEKKENDLKLECGSEIWCGCQTRSNPEADLEALLLTLEVRRIVRGDYFLVSFQESVLAPNRSCQRKMKAEHT